jgi:uncharacterized membrane-anchored protein
MSSYKVRGVAVLHEPRLDTILMIEEAILKSDNYPTKTQLWKKLPRKIQYQTFKRVIDYLEASDKIAFNGGAILYVGQNNEKLRALIESSIRVR